MSDWERGNAVTTCSYQSALIAAEGRNYVTSIDTTHVSAGQALVVLSMARYLEKKRIAPWRMLSTWRKN